MPEVSRERIQQNNSKEIWQMTKAEYEEIHGSPRGNSTVTGKFSPHLSAVEIAVNRGLPVPEKVLDDYPFLKDM